MVQFTEELRQIARTVEAFVDNEVEPFANQIEEEDRVPEHLLDKAKQLGLYGMGIPKSTADSVLMFSASAWSWKNWAAPITDSFRAMSGL